MATKQGESQTRDPAAARAESILDYVLNDMTDVDALRQTTVPQEQITPAAPARAQSRVLFVAHDRSLLSPDTELRRTLVTLGAVFDEVHILVVDIARQRVAITERLDERVFFYATSASHWWGVAGAVAQVAAEQLQFNDGFRADIIVGLDPFLAGYAAQTLARTYDRPHQIHVLADYLSDEFLRTQRHAKWLRRLAAYVLKEAPSVCAASETIKAKLQKQYPKLAEPILLPRFYNIKDILANVTSEALIPKLANFKFVMLYVGSLNHESTLFRAIDATRSVLRSPSIALVVIGDGPMRKDFVRRTEIFGIKEQVFFEPSTVDVVSYMRSAHLLLMTDTTVESEEVVIKAAAVGLPLLLAHTELRDDIFTDALDAFLCQQDDTIEFSQKLSKFLNNNAIRVQFAREARATIKDRLYEDPEVFQSAYRDAIESVFATIPLENSSV